LKNTTAPETQFFGHLPNFLLRWCNPTSQLEFVAFRRMASKPFCRLRLEGAIASRLISAYFIGVKRSFESGLDFFEIFGFGSAACVSAVSEKVKLFLLRPKPLSRLRFDQKPQKRPFLTGAGPKNAQDAGAGGRKPQPGAGGRKPQPGAGGRKPQPGAGGRKPQPGPGAASRSRGPGAASRSRGPQKRPGNLGVGQGRNLLGAGVARADFA
jgi:hypothetical protein